MARQPEVAGNIQSAMIIAASLVEGVTFLALIVCFAQVSRPRAEGIPMIASPFASVLLVDAGDEANLLDWKSDLAIWTAVVFVVLLAVLWKFAWKPIAEGLDKREKQMADQIAEAERNNRDARQLLADYQQKLAASQGEVRGILDQARREAEQLGREMLEKARDEGRAEHARALAADRGRHGRRLAGIGPAVGDPGRRAGRQDRRQPADCRAARRIDPRGGGGVYRGQEFLELRT